MHVLPLPFGLALVLLPRREVRFSRDDERPIRLTHEPHWRDRILADPYGAAYRRQV
jgi:hypothetical protein